VAVVGVPDDYWSEQVAAFVRPAAGNPMDAGRAGVLLPRPTWPPTRRRGTGCSWTPSPHPLRQGPKIRPPGAGRRRRNSGGTLAARAAPLRCPGPERRHAAATQQEYRHGGSPRPKAVRRFSACRAFHSRIGVGPESPPAAIALRQFTAMKQRPAEARALAPNVPSVPDQAAGTDDQQGARNGGSVRLVQVEGRSRSVSPPALEGPQPHGALPIRSGRPVSCKTSSGVPRSVTGERCRYRRCRELRWIALAGCRSVRRRGQLLVRLDVGGVVTHGWPARWVYCPCRS
jgi:hypothetical protein